MAYSFKRRITIDRSQVGAGVLTDYPLCFAGTYAGAAGALDLRVVGSGGKITNASGFDFAFFNDFNLATALDFERVYWVDTTGEVECHVKIPSLNGSDQSTDTQIWIGYNDSSISTDQQDAVNTWDANFKGVYHMGSPTSVSGADSTGSSNDGTPSNVSAAAGKIGGAASFNGTTSYIDLGTPSDFNFSGTQAFTIQTWFNSGSISTAMALISRFNSGVTGQYLYQVLTSLQRWVRNVTPFSGLGTGTLSNSTWYLGHLVYDGTNVSLFLNNNADNTPVANGSVPSDSTSMNIGCSQTASARSTFWSGLIDEMRISNVARASNWRTADYNNQNNPNIFYGLSGELPGGAPLLPLLGAGA